MRNCWLVNLIDPILGVFYMKARYSSTRTLSVSLSHWVLCFDGISTKLHILFYFKPSFPQILLEPYIWGGQKNHPDMDVLQLSAVWWSIPITRNAGNCSPTASGRLNLTHLYFILCQVFELELFHCWPPLLHATKIKTTPKKPPANFLSYTGCLSRNTFKF